MPLMFHDVRLPEEIEQGAVGGPTFYTNVTTQSSGFEQRVSLWDRQRLMWQVGYGINSKEDYKELLDFYYARRGRAYGFRFRDHSDYTTEDEPFGTGNGTSRVFRLAKSYETGGPLPYIRPITHPEVDTVVIKVAGVLADSSTYDVDINGIIRFHSGHAPANTAALTWSGNFDTPVRFDIDQMNLTLYALASGEIANNALPIIELREQLNNPPTAITASTVYHSSLNENTDTSTRIAILDFDIVDDDLGVNAIGLTGTNPLLFEVVLSGDTRSGTLYLKAGTVLDFETLASLEVTIGTWDTVVGDRPSATLDVTLAVNDVAEPPVVTLTNVTKALAAGTDTTSRVLLADIGIAVDFGQTTGTTLTGTDASHFEIFGGNFYLRSGEDTTIAVHHYLDVQIVVTPSIAAATVVPMELTIGIVPGEITYDAPGTYTHTVGEYEHFEIDVWAAGCASWGYTPGAPTAPTPPGLTYVQNDQTVTTFHRWHVEPFRMADNPDAWTPGYTAVTATMNSYGVGAALTATVTGHEGGAGVAIAQRDSSFDQTSGAGGYTLALDGSVILGGAGVRAAAPTESASVANGLPGTAPGTGGSGGAYKLNTLNIGQIMPGSGTFPPPSIQFAAMAGAGSGHFAKQVWTYASAQIGSGAGYTAPAPAVGDVLTIVVGAGGLKGVGTVNGADGQHGRVRLAWS